MFGIVDFFQLILSLFLILPAVSIIRESGYIIAATIFGAKNKKITIGVGPKILDLSFFEIRKYYFMYSWCTYESIRYEGKWAHILIYSAPIAANFFVALVINGLLAADILSGSFWEKFIFYAFYFVLFDALPLYFPDGQPSNGRVVFELLKYGKRIDFDKEDPKKIEDEGRHVRE
ncbi:hypothetical protein [Alteribacillus iranensis]|uniref:Uncharacterized protein n=1 Tax=Alteribacillus iranensis TaxID=930128 RepID=A0A1I2D695_9BACI|nr:hypothetical protein [Alteribacillus iranensis]SFE75593.1 hypothetical protein SAMN05192532_103414 [Alteribacillus iranensis]